MKALVPYIYSIVFIFGCISCAKHTQSLNQENIQFELIDARDLDPAEIAAYDRAESAPFQGISMKDCLTMAINKSKDTLYVNEILSSGMLYVRYSQYACGDCIKFLNSSIMEYNTKEPLVKVRFLIKDIGVRDIHVLENEMGNNIEIFKVDSLPTDFDEAYTPYIFKIDENLNIHDYYIPRKELPDSLHAYLYK